MKRSYLYFFYAALWILTIWLLYGVRLSGAGPLPTMFFYGAPVFLLYILTLFLLDVREDTLDPSLVKAFFRRRQLAIGFFLFGMIVLILLLFQVNPTGESKR